MLSPEEPSWCRAVLEAVHSLDRAVRTLRQHASEPRLGQVAVARWVAAIQAATASQPVALRLDLGSVRHGNTTLLQFTAGEIPFGALAAAGVGEVVLPLGMPGVVAERLVRVLAAAITTTDSEADIAAQLRTADLPGVQILAATTSGAAHLDPGRADWWLLPIASAMVDVFQPLVEHDRETNLPAIAARLLLADLDAEPRVAGPLPALLDTLLAAMLQRGDAAHGAWLLEQAQHHPSVPATVALQLRSRAYAAFHGDWLLAQVANCDQVQGLVALGMQLGTDSVQRLAAAAAAAGQPLPGWLLEFVPPLP